MTTAKKSLGTIGKCIYCGDSEGSLSEEHILPLSLGGEFTLKKASCKKCQKITSGLERDVLKYTLKPVRTKMGLPTRHKNKSPTEFPLTVVKEGQKETIEVPIAERPTLLMLPEFKKPAYIDKRKYKKGIEIVGVLSYQIGQPSFREFAAKHGVTSISETVTYTAERGFNFARLLAKIAYGFAIAHYGAGIIDDNYIVPALLGWSDDIGKWVGSNVRVPTSTESIYQVGLSVEDGNIHCYIRLFANLKPVVPEYIVVIGHVPNIK